VVLILIGKTRILSNNYLPDFRYTGNSIFPRYLFMGQELRGLKYIFIVCVVIFLSKNNGFEKGPGIHDGYFAYDTFWKYMQQDACTYNIMITNFFKFIF
jgi:hypothetical protein